MVKYLVLFALCVAQSIGRGVWQDGSGYRSNTGGLYNFSSLHNMQVLQGDFGRGNSNYAGANPPYNQAHDAGQYRGFGSSNYNQGGGYNASRGMWQRPGQGNRTFADSVSGYGSNQNVAHNSGHGLWNASSQWGPTGSGQANGYASNDYNSNQRQWHGQNRDFWNSSSHRAALHPGQDMTHGNVGGYTGNYGSNHGQWNSTTYRDNSFGGGQGGSYGANVNNRNATAFGRGSINSPSSGYPSPGETPYGSNQNPWNRSNSPFDIRFGGTQGSFNQSHPMIY